MTRRSFMTWLTGLLAAPVCSPTIAEAASLDPPMVAVTDVIRGDIYFGGVTWVDTEHCRALGHAISHHGRKLTEEPP